MATPHAFDEKSRAELLDEARRMGVERPERMTRVELRDEIVRRSVPDDRQAEARGLFGVARSMLASVVESGLNLPDAAKLIRGESKFEVPVASRTPVATVTLAEIYAAQGHTARALRVLEDVLRQEPEHEEALRVRAQLLGEKTSANDSASFTQDALREDTTREAPPVSAPSVVELEGATTEYLPGGFVETTGEEVETGQPPPVDVSDVGSSASQEEAPPSSDVHPALSRDEASEHSFQRALPALVLSQTREGIAFYWELPHVTLDECSIDPSEGRAVIRLVGFKVQGTSPSRQERTVPAEETTLVAVSHGIDAGRYWVDAFAEPTAVRAALGWETEDGFLPLTVGRPLESLKGDGRLAPLRERARAQLF